MPDSVGRREIARLVSRLEKRHVETLFKIRKDYVDQNVGGTQTKIDVVAHMAEVARIAMSLGYTAAGTPRWVETASQKRERMSLAETEAKYFLSLLLVKEAMDPARRIPMYGGFAWSGFWRGFASNMPTGSVIHWRLGIAEHCRDCLNLASKSPYTKPGPRKGALPTVPRNGDTRCLNNCRCRLVVNGAIAAGLFNEIGVEVIAIGMLAVDPTSPAAQASASVYQSYADLYAYQTRRAHIEGGAWAGAAAATHQRMLATGKSMGQTIRMAASDQEIIEDVSVAVERGYRPLFAVNASDEIIGAAAVVVAADSLVRGTIAQVHDGYIVLDGDESEQYHIGERTGTILFLEP
jgi:hypothetical protein